MSWGMCAILVSLRASSFSPHALQRAEAAANFHPHRWKPRLHGAVPRGTEMRLVAANYLTSKNLSFGALQIGHLSGGSSPMTVLPHTGQTQMRPGSRSLPAFWAWRALE